MDEAMDKATFAGGCFWCMQPPFDRLEGVLKTVPGYAGGKEEDGVYKKVSSGGTGHREAVQVFYDAARISYEKLLDVFWTVIDPVDAAGQYADKGLQYTTAIYCHSQGQQKAALASKKRLEKRLGVTVATEILPFTTFFPAEEYHRDYYKKNPVRYNLYKWGSGRGQAGYEAGRTRDRH